MSDTDSANSSTSSDSSTYDELEMDSSKLLVFNDSLSSFSIFFSSVMLGFLLSVIIAEEICDKRLERVADFYFFFFLPLSSELVILSPRSYFVLCMFENFKMDSGFSKAVSLPVSLMSVNLFPFSMSLFWNKGRNAVCSFSREDFLLKVGLDEFSASIWV